jgi:Rod binding domain-containing protein
MVEKVGNTSSHPAAGMRNDPAKVRDAACQFESLLIGQLMKSMSSAGWMGDEDQAGSTATEMAEEQFARAMAQQGGLGLARLIVSGLQAKNGSGG